MFLHPLLRFLANMFYFGIDPVFKPIALSKDLRSELVFSLPDLVDLPILVLLELFGFQADPR